MSTLSDKALFISTVGKLGTPQPNESKRVRASTSKPLTSTLADLIKFSGEKTGKAVK